MENQCCGANFLGKQGSKAIFKTKFHDLSLTFSMAFVALFPCILKVILTLANLLQLY